MGVTVRYLTSELSMNVTVEGITSLIYALLLFSFHENAPQYTKCNIVIKNCEIANTICQLSKYNACGSDETLCNVINIVYFHLFQPLKMVFNFFPKQRSGATLQQNQRSYNYSPQRKFALSVKL